MAERRTSEIRDFILGNVGDHPSDIASIAAGEFSISRQAVHRHLRQLVAEGVLSATGQTRGRRYELAGPKVWFREPIKSGIEEGRLWQERVGPLLDDVPANVRTICQYGFTEMVNNALTHSQGTTMEIQAELRADLIRLLVHDDGIGIFRKIRRDLGLADDREAILELAKGKLTTDPAGHTGEGVFFTSRAFDFFALASWDLRYFHRRAEDDWLIESARAWEQSPGTGVDMRISPRFTGTVEEVFDRYATPDAYDFSRTHVPVALARYGEDNLISRSQARRLLSRFNRFREVLLDFNNVDMIGQAFADEIFRVFARDNPQVKLLHIRANDTVEKMIRHVLAASGDGSG
ncbi:MAG TPA: DUF4325 domain-containing protein [Phycisphaerae bacterium]|nr:DUF4325 domain-containing protein [Phycisphaerae bacterium]